MHPGHRFRFLRVRSGRTYYARVGVKAGSHQDGAIRSGFDIGVDDRPVPDAWLKSALRGVASALASYGHFQPVPVGLLITSVEGTEVDTDANAVEVAAFCAGWMALGGEESRLDFHFNDGWQVRVRG